MYCFYIMFGYYGEYIGVEFCNYLAALTQNLVFINAFALWQNINDYIYYFDIGYTSVFRTYIGIAIGERNKKKYDFYYKKFLQYGLSIITGMVVVLFFFGK